MTTVRTVLTLVTTLIVFVLAGPASAQTTVRRFEDDPIRVVEARLDNGLTVLLTENHQQSEVFGAIVARVGAKNDPAEHTGMAHYLEHMLFKGTRQMGTIDWGKEKGLLVEIEALYERLGTTEDPEARKALLREIDAVAKRASALSIPNELDRLLAEIGGSEVNAFTTPDFTVYYNRLPASQLSTWLEIYAHRFEHPVFRLFPSELEAVYEEKNIALDGYMDAAYEAFMSAFFPGHPYGSRPVLGTVEHLKRPSLRAMREHYETWYVPGNMALVLSGDFDAEALLPEIERTFGQWKARPLPPRDMPEITPFEGRVAQTVRVTPLRAAALAWRLPPRGHRDTAELMVLQELISNEQSSGLVDRLVDRGKLLYAQVLPLQLVDGDGVVIIYVPNLLQPFSSAERHVRTEIDRFRAGRLSSEELEGARRNVARRLQARWESNEDRVLTLADGYARGLSWQRYVDIIEELAEVGPQDIQAAAARHLGGDFLALRSRMGFPKRPQLEKPGFSAVTPPKGAQSAFSKRIHPLPDSEVEFDEVDFVGDFERVDVAPGVELVANPNPVNDLYQLEIRFGLGRYHRPELVRLAEYLERVGATRRGARGFKEALYAEATTLDAWASDEAFVISIRGPEDRLATGLALVAELVEHPAADARRLRRLRRESWANERLDRGSPSGVSTALWNYVLYGDDSDYKRYGHLALRRYGVDELLAALDDVQDFETEIRYVGTRPAAEVARLARSTLSFRDRLRPAAGLVSKRRRPITRDQVFWVKQRGAVQTHAWFWVEGDPIGPEMAALSHAYDAYMGGGMAGIVFQEIREFRALAYSSFAGWAEPSLLGDAGYFYAYLGCQADKTPEALSVLHGLIEGFPERPGRIGALRNALARGQESEDPSFRQLQAQVDAWRWQGARRDPRPRRLETYRSLDLEALRSFWKTQVAGRPKVLVVVGNPRTLDRDLLERYGDVTIVPEWQLYTPD